MKRASILIGTVAIAACAFCEPLPDGGPYTNIVDGIEWTFMVENGEAVLGGRKLTGNTLHTFTAVSPLTGGDLLLPQTLGGHLVTKIGMGAFGSCSLITSVDIPSSVRVIESSAFEYCDSLEVVSLAEGLVEIENWAFDACENLYSVNIPLSVRKIDAAFCNTPALGGGLVYVDGCLIANNSFEDEELIIEEGTRIIAGRICSNNEFLKRVCFPSSLEYIGNRAFANVKNLREINIPDGEMGLGGYVFEECTGLHSLTVGEGLSEIPLGFCWGCSNLTSVILPASVTNIQSSAFGNEYRGYPTCLDTLQVGTCINIKESFPEAYKTLKHLILLKNSDQFSSCPCKSILDVQLPTGIVEIGNNAFYGCECLSEIVIPDGVTNIAEYAFQCCTKLTTVSIPPSVVCIGQAAFSRCESLKSIIVPNGVTEIPRHAFANCNSLLSIILSDSLTIIEQSAFEGCSSLQHLTVPSLVSNIGLWAFEDCTNLAQIDFEGRPPEGNFWSSLSNDILVWYNAKYADEWQNVLARKGMNNTEAYVPTKSDGGPYMEIVDDIEWSFIVQDGQAIIVNNMSYATSCVGDVTIPSLLGNRSVVRIESGAFDGCDRMTAVVIPTSVISIGDSVFAGCIGLTSVTVPPCLNWFAIDFSDSLATLEQVVLEDGWTTVDGQMFECMPKLKDVIIPATVTAVDDYAFNKCSGLTNITFKGDVPDFGVDVFYGTPRKMTITITEDAIGWDDYDEFDEIPPWGGRNVVGNCGIVSDTEGTGIISLCVTNVVVHYVLNSVQPEIAVPVSNSVGFVNVITEVKSGGAVSIPTEWKDNYAIFESNYGSDFGKALMKPTGKVDGAGNAMLVWQDYVAGTDPTNPDDKFKASVTMVNGEPVVSWTPELPTDQADLRKYTTYGKARLQDTEWTVVNGDAAKYNFFKVTVEMK